MIKYYYRKITLDLKELFLIIKTRFNSNNWYYYSVLIFLGTLLYFQSFYFDFVYLDDNELILNNTEYLKNLGNIFDAFTKDVFYSAHSQAAYYRPLLTVSFIFEASLFGISTFVFHFSNILIHLCVTLLIFKLIQKIIKKNQVAFLLSLFFLIHPALTQAVSWVPGRNDSLLALFVFLSFFYFLNYLEKEKVTYYLLSLFFFGLGLFTKETALVFPFLLMFYLWQNYSLTRKIFLKFTSGWLLITLIWLPFRQMALQNPIKMTFSGMIVSLFKNSPATLQLLGKSFFPFNLSVLPNIPDTTFIWGILAFLLILFFIFLKIKNGEDEKNNKSYLMIFGLLWFVLLLVPSFIRPDPEIIADFIEHRLYLPIFGLMLFLTQTPLLAENKKKNKKYLAFFWITLLIVFTFINFDHQKNFSEKFSFWQNAAQNSPHSPLAQKNLGAMYYLHKNNEMAEVYYKKALELNKFEPMVHSNLGLIYVAKGDLKQAEKEYLEELSFNPSYDNVHFNLGIIYYNTQRFGEARKQWEETLKINPDYIDAKNALAALENSKK